MERETLPKEMKLKPKQKIMFAHQIRSRGVRILRSVMRPDNARGATEAGGTISETLSSLPAAGTSGMDSSGSVLDSLSTGSLTSTSFTISASGRGAGTFVLRTSVRKGGISLCFKRAVKASTTGTKNPIRVNFRLQTT